MTTASPVPATIDDPINLRILRISEDQLQGFQREPFSEIARQSDVELKVVLERVHAMLEAGTIRRVRQTMVTTSLALGSLVAWQIPEDRLSESFNYLFEQDPFSGHVVIRTTDSATPGSHYRLWTTLKVPPQFSIEKHAEFLAEQIGAQSFRLMPAKKLFALGVGHMRRREIEAGARSDDPGRVIDTAVVPLTDHEWDVIEVLKREFTVDELVENPWTARATKAGIAIDDLFATADALQEKGVVGRFSTFLEHVKSIAGGQRVTRYNALFHWAVPAGQELDAGREVGRHHIMTHAYWREGGPEFRDVNIMGVAHGTDKDLVLAHKAAIDTHLEEAGISVGYSNVFWGGRSEIKPSEISPGAYLTWCESAGIDPASMRSSEGNA
jgi:hypothetical protein